MTEKELDGLAHELWAAAQMAPNESILDSVDKIKEVLKEYIKIEE